MTVQRGDHEGSSPSYGVVVSLHDIYNQMQLISDRQATLLGKLDALGLTFTAQVEGLNKDIAQMRIDDANFRVDYVKGRDDHELRIRALVDRVHTLETRPHVTPKALLSAVTMLIAAIGVATAIISVVTR